ALLAWAQARDLALFWANAVTALAFGAAHLLYAPPAHAAAVIAPALALGFVYERTRSLAPCIALHALFNAVWLACVTSL
ncbi:MAG: CPBP family glutamic-type intramembrane protease, partial [Burkholderiaceae bacterium]|nr:CPBP family glutamic-type intramembrane protease [Burkholderiaceae bacterium]